MAITGNRGSRPSPGLTSLPSEILIQIYTCLNSFAEVTRLAVCCRRLNDIWEASSNSEIIYQAVGPKCIECFEDAEALLLLEHEDDIEEITTRTRGRQLRENAAKVERSVEFFNARVCRAWSEPYLQGQFPHPPYMLPSERLRYIHSYYRCWVLKDSSREARELILQGVGLAELGLLWESGRFLNSCCSVPGAPEFGETGWPIVYKAIMRHQFAKAFDDLGMHYPPSCPAQNNVPYNINAFWDHKQWWYEELAAGIAARIAERAATTASGSNSA